MALICRTLVRGMKTYELGCAFGLLLGVQGCASGYEPARSPRVAMMMDGGRPVFVRDGQHYESFLPSSALLDAVHGDPRAESEAQKARNLQIGGLVFVGAGLGTLVGATAVIANSHASDEHAALAGGLLVSSIALEMISLVFTLNAVPHLYNAMNIYNDDIDRARPPVPPPAPLARPSTPALLGPRTEPPPSAGAVAPASSANAPSIQPPSAAFPPE